MVQCGDAREVAIKLTVCRYMNAAKYGLNKVFFSGCFIRGELLKLLTGLAQKAQVSGHASTISTLSYAIRFWSKGTMRACFLRHEGFLSVSPSPPT
jgi:type II pantothenate kinase